VSHWTERIIHVKDLSPNAGSSTSIWDNILVQKSLADPKKEWLINPFGKEELLCIFLFLF
jgi:hypothetical protein